MLVAAPAPVPQPESTHRAERELGPAVSDGVINWLSSSLIMSADPQSEGGCLRRFWYDHVAGLRDREGTAAMAKGTKFHAEIEHYQSTGAMIFSPQTLAGIAHIPKYRTPGYRYEVSTLRPDNSAFALIEGLRFAGHMDVLNNSGTYLTPEGVTTDDATTIEIRDWKFTSDLDWAKNPAEVARTIQMNGYATVALAMADGAGPERVRLSHVYMTHKGKPAARCSTSLVDRAAIDKRWEYARAIVRSAIHAAAEKDAEKIPATSDGCFAYHKDCTHRGYCTVGRFGSLAAILGPRAAARLTKPEPVVFLSESGSMPLSLLDLIPDASKAKADLLAAEEAQRAALAAPQPLDAPPEFTQALGAIHSAIVALDKQPSAAPFGFPTLKGRAARMFGTINKHQTIVELLPGRGQLVPIEIEDPAVLVQLAAELSSRVAALTAAAIPSVLPPDAPVSNPAKAALPVEATAAEVAAAPAAVAAPAPAAETTTTRKRAKRDAASLVIDPAAEAKAPQAGGGEINVFVNCVVDGDTPQSLAPYLRTIQEQALQAFEVNGARLCDVRCGGNDSLLGYGKWRGVVAALVVATPPAPGCYFIDARADEIAEAALPALREAAVVSGGVFVRGY